MTNQSTKQSTHTPYLLLSVAVLFAYFRIFQAGFIAWDDADYTLHNPDIRAIDGTHIKAWFSGFYLGNYHPLTMLSLAIDYLIGGNAPFQYHLTNILLHIASACLVFRLASKLRLPEMAALAVALLFALHPMQMESVAWIAERKTILSGLFSLLALNAYTTYSPGQKNTLWLVWLWALMAMLSKGTAVVLPITFIAIDVFSARKAAIVQHIYEKGPVLLLSLIFGWLAISAQQSGGFVQSHTDLTFGTRLVYAAYAYSAYLWRFIAPVSLSAMYPYPAGMGAIEYIGCATTLGIAIVFFLGIRKRWYILSGSILFYTACIIPVLQLIPFGEALMADRYMYLAMLGPAIAIVYHLFRIPAIASKFRWAVVAILAISFGTLSLIRSGDWLNDDAFFAALVRAFPESAVAQYSVGVLEMRKNNLPLAEVHLEKAVRLERDNYKALHNLGVLYMREGRAGDALETLNRCLSIANYPPALLSRALLHQSTGNLASAVADAKQVVDINPANAKAWSLLGTCYTAQGDLQKAMQAHDNAVDLDRTEPLYILERGKTLYMAGRYASAITDLSTGLSRFPRSRDGWFYLGMSKVKSGQSPCADLRRAADLNYSPAAQALEQYCTH